MSDILFAGEPRYHVPLLPVVAAVAAATIVRAGEMLMAGAAGEGERRSH